MANVISVVWSIIFPSSVVDDNDGGDNVDEYDDPVLQSDQIKVMMSCTCLWCRSCMAATWSDHKKVKRPPLSSKKRIKIWTIMNLTHYNQL